jgi:hypothetical protein
MNQCLCSVGVVWDEEDERPCGDFKFEEAAIAAWNTRAPVQEAEDFIDAYEDILRLGMLSKELGNETWLDAAEKFSEKRKAYRARFPKQSALANAKTK